MDANPVKAVKAAFDLGLIIKIIVVMMVINLLLSFVPQLATYFWNPKSILDKVTGGGSSSASA